MDSPTDRESIWAPSLVLIATLGFAYLSCGYWNRLSRHIPFVNQRKYFLVASKDIVIAARAKFPLVPYKLICDAGQVIVVPHTLLNALKRHPDLSFYGAFNQYFHDGIPGFEPMAADERVPSLINKYLTQGLPKLTIPLSDEATTAVQDFMGDCNEWTEIDTAAAISGCVYRLSNRIFMGRDLCRDITLSKIFMDYTIVAFSAADDLRNWPLCTRRYIHWFLPSCGHTRRLLQDARDVLEPLVRQRAERKAQVLGEKFDDCIEWFETELKEDYDPTITQIQLIFVAKHTTSDMLTQAIMDIAEHPYLFQALRDEIIENVGSAGLSKPSLQGMKLMDSMLKESQRRKPSLLAPFRRLVTKDFQLPTGEKFFKNEIILADVAHMWFDSSGSKVGEFDAYRYMRRLGGRENDKTAALVTTSPEHIGFGHGRNACPGRFFAATMVKVLLCHMLLKYDWKLVGNVNPKPLSMGVNLVPDPTTKIVLKGRKPEIDLAMAG